MFLKGKRKHYMKILLKNATILDNKSAFHFQNLDVFIQDGIIQKIGENIDIEADKVILKDNLHLSKGWFDSSVCFGEPGYEERETLDNGLKTASLSGFTEIAIQPETIPVVDNQAAVIQLKNHPSIYPTQLHPIATFSKGKEGKNLTEFYDLQQKGAIAFSDFLNPVQNPELLKTALLYSQRFNGLILSFPRDKSIAQTGVVHEGEMSTKLGLSGIPSLSESLQIQRDLHLLDYTGGKIHIPYISSAEGVEMIRNAKQKGLQVSCSVALANLALNDEVIGGFDTAYKLLPPLRTKKDQIALKEGLLEGTIDMITSHHQPLNLELKQVEFEHATHGSIGLESMFGILNTLFPIEKVIQLLTQGRTVFGLATPKIEVGEKANLTLFNPQGNSVFKETDILSQSKNCAFIGQKTVGSVYGSIYGDQFAIK